MDATLASMHLRLVKNVWHKLYGHELSRYEEWMTVALDTKYSEGSHAYQRWKNILIKLYKSIKN